MFQIKKQFQISVTIPTPLATGNITIGDQPQLRNVKTVAIESYVSTGLAISSSNAAVIPVFNGITVTLSIRDNDGVSRENFIALPLSTLIRTLNGGIYTKFPAIMIDWSKSYVTVSNTTGLTAGQAIALSVYYE